MKCSWTWQSPNNGRYVSFWTLYIYIECVVFVCLLILSIRFCFPFFCCWLDIEIRRIDRELKKQHKTSADVDHRRQAVIAAAEAREKAHKAKSKPLKHITKTTLAKQQQQLQEGNLSGEDLNSEVSNEPLTVEAQKAAALAKQGEARIHQNQE